MSRNTRGAWFARARLIGIMPAVWAGAVGCDTQAVPVLGLLNSDNAPVVGAAVDTQELGNEWASALAIQLPADGSISLTGSIETDDDVDVFDLGPLSRGDRIVIDTSQGGGLDAALGLFDENANALLVNDDRSYFLGLYDPHIDHIVREDLSRCYVAIAASPYQPSTGEYTLTIQRRPDAAVPVPREQVVLLDFDGGTGVRIGSRQPINVPAFDAADIDSRYAGQTDEIVDIIEAMFMEEYDDYDIDFYSTADGDEPGGNVTSVFFGTYDPDLLGLADSVDAYNRRLVEECIVFVETFRLFLPLNPTVEQMAIALGNVATHELGHLLGLNHTRDATEVMDITAPAQDLLVDQTLHVAPLEEGVFPIGLQDPRTLLMQALGAR